MAYVQRRHNKHRAKVRIPKPLQADYGGAEFLYRTIHTGDRRAAKAEANAWEAELRAIWAERLGHDTPALAVVRQVYERTREEAKSWRADMPGEHPVVAAIDLELDRMAEGAGERELTPIEQARLAALQDAAEEVRGRKAKPRRELEPSFSELAAEYIKTQRRDDDGSTNRLSQLKATFRLFGSYWEDRPIREVSEADAAGYIDGLAMLDPSYARSPTARELSWRELQRTYGNSPRGLAAGTLNRHGQDLKALWAWARKRGYCEGDNPFDGNRKKLTRGRNVQGYLPWETGELKKLWTPAPGRSDLAEVMLVGMFTGMRINEIAALEWRDIREEAGVPVFDIREAKTLAGVRLVAIHPRLAWLLERDRGEPTARIWPTFNPEGPGKKPGADASREFSRYKASRGFTDRRKSFHSFRKNVVGQLERLGVPESEVAQLVGHEKPGFTFRTYGTGAWVHRMAEIVAMIDYPGLALPTPARPVPVTADAD